LRAVIDPDFPGKWWYVQCAEDPSSGAVVPRADRVKGSACFGPDPSKPERFGSLSKPPSEAAMSGKGVKKGTSAGGASKQKTNLWSDPSTAELHNFADGGFWLPYGAYWRGVRKRVVESLWSSNGLAKSSLDLANDGEPR